MEITSQIENDSDTRIKSCEKWKEKKESLSMFVFLHLIKVVPFI